MFSRSLDDLEKLGRIKYPADASFRSARYVTAADRMGFSYNENRVKAGTDLTVWLKHHWEANYIVSGWGEVTDLANDERYRLEAGVLYVVGPNDRHRLHLTEDECHVSMFCPPLTGEGRFDEDGSYEPSGPIEPTDRRMFAKTVDALRQAGEEVITCGGKSVTIPMLTKADDIGFGLSDVRLAAGARIVFGDVDQWQASHIISGGGEVTNLDTGDTSELSPGMACFAEPGDEFRVTAGSDIHFLSITCPPSE